MTLTLPDIRHCLESEIVSTLATSDQQGLPNIIYLSDAFYVDLQHIALSYQFFNKTRHNILENPRATLLLTDPRTLQNYQLTLLYLRTETQGPIFEIMKVRLASIAEWTHMQDIFHLRGADIYRVLHIVAVPGPVVPVDQRAMPERTLASPFNALRDALNILAGIHELNLLLDTSLRLVEQCFDCAHGVLLMPDESTDRLFAIGSAGYERSGIGAEVHLGEGLIGICAQQRCIIRINHRASDYVYSDAIRRTEPGHVTQEISLPSLDNVRSQMALPLLHQESLLGVLYLESEFDHHFTIEHEDQLKIFVDYLSLHLHHLLAGDAMPPSNLPSTLPDSDGSPLHIRYYASNQSIFVDDEYLIKGIAGALLWTMLQDHEQFQRTEFSNRELRLDSRIGLPEISSNLETRLLLLQRRLAERCEDILIRKTGRGRFRLEIARPLQLSAMADHEA